MQPWCELIFFSLRFNYLLAVTGSVITGLIKQYF